VQASGPTQFIRVSGPDLKKRVIQFSIFEKTHSDACLDLIFPEFYWFKFNKWICSENLRT
jgi:hypothetical protein